MAGRSKVPQDEAVLKAVFGEGLYQIALAGIVVKVATTREGLVVNIPSWGICKNCNSIGAIDSLVNGYCERCATGEP